MTDTFEATQAATALDDATPGEGDWTASLAPDLKQLVETKGYKSPADVVQAYAHAQRAIGADKIPALARRLPATPPRPAARRGV